MKKYNYTIECNEADKKDALIMLFNQIYDELYNLGVEDPCEEIY